MHSFLVITKNMQLLPCLTQSKQKTLCSQKTVQDINN